VSVCRDNNFFKLFLLTTYVVEFATVGLTEDGKPYHQLWNTDEINALLKKHDLAKEETAEET